MEFPERTNTVVCNQPEIFFITNNPVLNKMELQESTNTVVCIKKD